MAAMLIHAAGESSQGVPPLPENTHAVALSVSSQAQLRTVLERLIKAGIPLRPIHECGGEYDGQLMAIGCQPCEREAIKRVVSDLPLVRDGSSAGRAPGLKTLEVVGS